MNRITEVAPMTNDADFEPRLVSRAKLAGVFGKSEMEFSSIFAMLLLAGFPKPTEPEGLIDVQDVLEWVVSQQEMLVVVLQSLS